MLNAAAENVRSMVAWSREDRKADGSPEGLPRIGSLGVVGAGIMGTAIAAAHAKHRIPVVLYDVNARALAGAVASIAAELREGDNVSPSESLSNWVRPTANLAEMAGCDLVLESIVEMLPAKLQLYSQLQRHLGRHTIVASNTSTIPIERLAGAVADASRFCGVHFCHPVRHRPLVEIVRGPRTSDLTIAAVLAHARSIDRIPIVVRDGPGFVVNRLLFPYLGEALQLLREGASVESIERAATDFGMAFGPLRMIDEIGLDTTLQAAWVLAAAFPERIVASPVLVSMIKAGRLGRKTEAGFFSYGGSPGTMAHNAADKAAAALISPWIESASRHTQESLTYRLVLPMLVEATRIVEEGVVRDVREIDLAVLFGLGFPAEKGGLFWWADTVGAKQIVNLLQSSSTMGQPAEPTPMLKNLASTGGAFYRRSTNTR